MREPESPQERIRQRAGEHRAAMESGSWWHSIDLGGGNVTPGVRKLGELRKIYASFGLPDDLTGKRVLDMGCWDGFYSFEAERHGAEVVAVDCFRPENFFRARQALRSNVEFHEMSVYALDRKKLGTFDIVLFLNVVYHLRHPLLGLERICEMTRDVAVIESTVSDNFFPSQIGRPILEFYELDELAGQYDNWWGPNTACLIGMTRASGFARADLLQREETRTLLKAFRNWNGRTPLESPPSLHVPAVFNPVTWERPIPVTGRHAFLGMYARGLPDDVTRDSLRVHAGSFGINPVHVGDSQYPGFKQINTPLPPGLDPGTVPVWIEAGARRSNEAEAELVEGSEW